MLKVLNRSVLLACLAMSLCACASQPNKPNNPSFRVDISEAKQKLEAISEQPKKLERPLVLIGGYMDPGFAAGSMNGRYHQLVADDRIVAIELGTCGSFDSC